METLYNIPIDDLENYRITKSGKIWSVRSQKFLKPKTNNGYLYFGNGKKDYAIHRSDESSISENQSDTD